MNNQRELGKNGLVEGIGRSRDAAPVSPYAPITTTSPDVLVPLLYASTAADGQILYEDSGATTPVDANGEPIGGVDWADNTIAIQQSTDASRALYQTGPGSPANHALFDGTDDHLIAGTTGDFDYLHVTTGMAVTIFALVRFDVAKNAGNRSTICGTSIERQQEGIWLAYEDAAGPGDAIRLFHSAGTGSSGDLTSAYSNANAITDALWHTVAVTYTDAAYDFYIDGVASGSGAWSPSGLHTDPAPALEIGNEYLDVAPHTGGIALEAFYNRVLTASEISDLHDWTGI